MKVMRDRRPVTVEVSADGEGLVSHAGSVLLAQVADKVGLTGALSLRLAGVKQRCRGHDRGRVIRDLAVMLADGGECVSDLGAVRDQEALFSPVASDSTAFRVVDRIASDPGLLEAVRAAHARARERFWKLCGAPARLTIDATLICAHSEKERAAGNYKGGVGFFPLQAYADQTREALGAMLRPGNAGANTAADHKTVLDRALAQIPVGYIEDLEILVRADSAGATHGLVALPAADRKHGGCLQTRVDCRQGAWTPLRGAPVGPCPTGGLSVVPRTRPARTRADQPKVHFRAQDERMLGTPCGASCDPSGGG